MACHDILFKEKRGFKEKSSVFSLITYNAIHEIVNSFLGVGFQFFFFFLILKQKSNFSTMSTNYFYDF